MLLFARKELAEASSPVFEHQMAARFQDVDAAGIVFFARFFDYVHDAYEAFLASAGQPLPDVLKAGEWAAPLRHVEADYSAPVRYGDVLLIQLVLARVAETEITLGFKVLQSTGRLCATVQTVHTFVTPKDFQRRSVPQELVAALLAITR